MNRIKKTDLFFGLYLVCIAMIYLIGIKHVPFHPDESTQIFMSSDVQIFLKAPNKLFWNVEPFDKLRQHYRELDAPLSRTIIGIGRGFWGLQNLKNDWVWGETWEENSENGALPDQKLLIYSRTFVAAFFPFSILLIYLIGIVIQGRTLGWLSALIFSLHPLILLHTRRAMAESLLIFSLLLSTYMLIKPPKRIWLISVPIALAFNAKQTMIGLFVAAMFVIFIETKENGIKKIFRNWIYFGCSFAAITILLNPFFWQYPLSATISAIKSRQRLTNAQMETYGEINDNLVLNSIQKKTIAFSSNILTTTPQIAESGNYIDDIDSSMQQYSNNKINILFVNQITPLLLAVLGGCGFAISIFLVGENRNKHKALGTFLVTFMSISISLFILLSLPFQRYYLPIIPFLCIFAAQSMALGGSYLLTKIKTLQAKR